MSKVSTELSARARNEVSRVLQALASSNQSQVAEQLGIDPSTLSRMKNDRKSNGLTELENCLVLLDILGFKTVLKKYRMISEEKLNALFVMSKAWMESKQTIDDLFKMTLKISECVLSLVTKKKPDGDNQA
ncbi:transcriptional regulator [Acinetobacter baumannii]